MGEADRTMCEKCMTVNDIDAEFCKRCGQPLPQNAPIPEYEQPPTPPNSYRAEHDEPLPQNAPIPEYEQPPTPYGYRGKPLRPSRGILYDFMHLSYGKLISLGVKLGVVLIVVEIIALVFGVIIFSLLTALAVLLGLGFSGGNLFGI
jgi:hypothetical protein